MQIHKQADVSNTAASVLETVATPTMANARATTELARLHRALMQQTATTSPALPAPTGDGNGAGSIAVYAEERPRQTR